MHRLQSNEHYISFRVDMVITVIEKVDNLEIDLNIFRS